jgi:hypothetical protein
MSASTIDTENMASPIALVSEGQAEGVRQHRPAVNQVEGLKKVDEIEDAVMIDKVDGAAPEAHAQQSEASASWIPVNEVNTDTWSTEDTNNSAPADSISKGSTTDPSVPDEDLETIDAPTPDSSNNTDTLEAPIADLEAGTSLVPKPSSLKQVSSLPPSPRSCSNHRNTNRPSSSASVSPPCTRVSGSS